MLRTLPDQERVQRDNDEKYLFHERPCLMRCLREQRTGLGDLSGLNRLTPEDCGDLCQGQESLYFF